MHGEGGAGELGEPFGDAGAFRPVAILVPPTVFDEEQTVLDLPMSTNGRQQFGGRYQARIQAGEKVACVREYHCAVVGNYVPINTHANLRPGKCQRFTNVLEVVQIETQSAAVDGGPFFSSV